MIKKMFEQILLKIIQFVDIIMESYSKSYVSVSHAKPFLFNVHLTVPVSATYGPKY